VSKDITALARHAAIDALAWIHIARVQQHLAERTAPAGAENAGVGIRIRDPGLGPGRYQGQGHGPGQETVIIMGGSQGHGRDPSRRNGAAPARTLGPGPVLARGPARGHGRGRGRAIGEVVGASAHAGRAPEASRRVAAAATVGSANDEEREAVRRMYVLVG
jgi:hypothetical protein